MSARHKDGIVILSTADDIRRGTRALRRRCPHLARAHDLVGDPPLRRIPAGFAGLVQIIVGQQVSAASAAAIWRRTAAALRPLTPGTVLAASDDQFRAAALSRPKIRTLRALAGAVAEGDLDLARLRRAGDDEIRETLTRVSGIGPWTAGIYLMFALGRADSFAAGDLALQISAERVLGLGERPSPAALEVIAERWRPWRAVAAHLLWHHYAVARSADQRSRAPSKRRHKTVG